MTDEELSELAECLEDACQEAVSMGYRVRQFRVGAGSNVCNCPLGFLTGCRYPISAPGVGALQVSSFIAGFDDDGVALIDDRAYKLGRQFRERYVGGS